MRDINRLILKAKKIYEPKREKLIYVMVGYNKPNSVTCTVWNGVQGQARQLEFDCSTREEALERIEEVYNEYPGSDEIHGVDMDKNAMIVISIESEEG